MGATAGDFPHSFGDIASLRVDRGRRADGSGEFKFLVGDVDGDDIGAEGVGDHDGRQADAAAAVHRHPLPGGNPALIDDRPKRRGKTAAQAGGGHEIDFIGQSAPG